MTPASAGEPRSHEPRALQPERAAPALEPDPASLRWRRIWCAAAAALAAAHAWIGRQVMDPMGISYLDMSDGALRGDWTLLVNGYWQPLYPSLLALGRWLVRSSDYWEATTVHLVNLAIFLGALATFSFFWSGVVRLHTARAGAADADGGVPLPRWMLDALGYGAFTWSSLEMISLDRASPDLCVAAFAYLAAGALVRIWMGPPRPSDYALLGAALGLGYLSKAAMFPIAFAFLATAYACSRHRRGAASGAVTACATFALLASLLVVPLSRQKGRLTFADTGTLVYSWFVNGVPMYAHWQGEPPGRGVPAHPMRRLRVEPAVYEFATPVPGTYPAWFDPSYWHEGLVPHVDPARQLRALLDGLGVYYDAFVELQAELFAVALLLFLGWRRSGGRALLGSWPLLAPAAAAMGMYGLVHTEPRFFGAFAVMLLAGLLAAAQLPTGPASVRAAQGACLVAVAMIAIRLAAATGERVAIRQPGWGHPEWRVAQDLRSMGLRPGDTVGSLGDGYDAYWARLAGVRIVVELPDSELDSYWALGEEGRGAVLRTMAAAGARAIVSSAPLPPPARAGWREVGRSGRWARLLEESGYR